MAFKTNFIKKVYFKYSRNTMTIQEFIQNNMNPRELKEKKLREGDICPRLGTEDAKICKHARKQEGKKKKKKKGQKTEREIKMERRRNEKQQKRQKCCLILPMQLIPCKLIGRPRGEVNSHFELIFVMQLFISVATKKLGFYSQHKAKVSTPLLF